MKRLRVLVVEDSLTVRRRLCEVLTSDPSIEIVGEAADGKVAIEMCQRLKPDVMTLDMMLPVMTGVAATEYIMAHVPTPILIVSSSTNRAELFKTYDALAAGAVDVLEKPRGDETDDAWERSLISSVKLVAKIKVITHLRARRNLSPSPLPPRSEENAREGDFGACRIVALGASTGGPGALVEVLRGLPPKLTVPVLMVIHIDEPFSAAFADWLDGQTTHRVAYAREGERLDSLGGRVVMAPPGHHLVARRGHLHLTTDQTRHSCRPSVDVLFESLARECGEGVVASLLTGMGRDGAAGLLDIRRAGGFTIAQDEATSIVYGMPREAALLGAAERILPLDDIGPTIGRILSGTYRSER
jgi:two-component system, chemotaxis family, protein-glutamate methylesterase/glutaminase